MLRPASVALFAIVILGSALLSTRHARAHGDAEWIAQGNFRSVTGEQCCGERDCHPVVPQQVQLLGDTYVIQFEGQTYSVSDREAQDSIDERYWICVWGGGMKCFFRPKLGS